MNSRNLLALSLATLLMLTGSTVVAKNVDLVTLPKRDTVQLTIYNSADLTLAKEVRAVTLKKGRNQLQFSWAGTLIDPTSVEFRPLQHADEIEVSDTVYPGQKPQHLIWNIDSEFEGEALVEVSYFTSGLTWTMDYVAISNPDETEMSLRGHVRVFNNSGEEYENAEIRLIVGKINLVEKIAQLAQQRGIPVPKKEDAKYDRYRRRAALLSIEEAREEEADKSGPRDGEAQIVKEGVSEYFMFSVEGRETVNNGWSKRMPAVTADGLQFDIVYRLRQHQYGPRPVRFFTWRNDPEHKLGESPLPNGVIRVFRENGNDGLSYLGRQSLNYVPIKAEMEVNLGADDLVVFERTKTGTRRDNFQFDRRSNVSGWDEHQDWTGLIRNYRNKPIAFELRRQWAGDVELSMRIESTAFDYRTVETKLPAAPRDSTSFVYTATIHQGANAKQNRLRLLPIQ